MPFTREHMGADDFQVSLAPDTPQSILDLTRPRTNGTANVVITPARFNPGDISDAALLDMACFVGVLLEKTDGGLNLEGDGLHWYLGDEDDGGNCFTGPDTPVAGVTISDAISVVESGGNGLTKGTVNASGTTRTLTLVDGTTMFAFLHAACRTFANPDYEYRINNDGSIDVNTRSTLFPTTTTPTVLLADQGGRDGAIVGLDADLEMPDDSIRDFRSHVEVNWNDGTNNGTSSPGIPAASNFVGFDGDPLIYRSSVQKSPRRSFRENPHRGNRFNASRYGVWAVTAQTQASNLAASIAAQAATAWYETSADIDEYDPGRFVQPGDSVWVYDLELGLVDTANEVYYQGEALHPKKERVEAMTCPILDGYGVYLRLWDGAAFHYHDLSDFVMWEDGPTTLELGVRAYLRRRRPRPDRFNRRRFRRQYRRFFLISKYVQSQH